MTERDQAILIAEMILDFQVAAPGMLYVHGDPDCDVAILARQYLRALERLELAEKALDEMVDSSQSSGVARRCA